jgi:hypothetical protein
MLAPNLENTESFHLPNETARAFIETGKFVEVKPEPKPAPRQNCARTSGPPRNNALHVSCVTHRFCNRS